MVCTVMQEVSLSLTKGENPALHNSSKQPKSEGYFDLEWKERRKGKKMHYITVYDCLVLLLG